MAKYIGSELNNGNYGEDTFCKLLIDAFPDEYIIYRNRQVFGREFDMAMLIPDIGIVVFEIKGWRESTVLRIENGDTIIIATEEGERPATPQKQVRGYRFAIERRIRQDLGVTPLVFCMVVYPQISRSYFLQKQLNKVTEEQFTILKEDMASSSAIQAKLSTAVNEVQMWHRARFDDELMYNTRCLFEGDIVRYTNAPSIAVESEKQHHAAYSKFYYIPDGSPISDEKLEQIRKDYSLGTKLYAVVGNKAQLKQIATAIDQVLDKKCLYRDGGNLSVRYEAFQVHHPAIASLGSYFSCFNCSISAMNGSADCDAFQVTDGVEKHLHDDLVKLSQVSGFNYEQYQVEHAPIDSNILIRAGAGTGKTFTMVSRIGFIAHHCAGRLLDLLDRVSMITFTNEAADQMQRKLKTYFQNSYLITGNKQWLHLIARIGQMQISTIHSYAKKLVGALGIECGYGHDISVTSSQFARQAHISQLINDYIEEKHTTQLDFIDKLGIPMYTLISDVVEFIQKLHNKNVDITQLTPAHFGEVENPAYGTELHDLLTYIIPRVEMAYQAELLEENRIHLSSIMSLLQILMQDPNGQRRIRMLRKTTASYLFVDEFQDTDNTQIYIIVKLCELLGSKLFVVGDVKQCIYRFRGATEEAFDQLPNIDDPTVWREYALQRNYRTDRQLLDIFDKSFRIWGQPDKKLLVYEPQRDRLLGTKNMNSGAPKKQFYRQLHTFSDAGRMETLFGEIERLRRWIDQDLRNGVKLSEEEKIIAILVRENWQAEAIKREGKRRNVTIQTHTGGDLYQTVMATDMLALVNALLHYDEPKYLFSLLSSNFFRVHIPHSMLYQIRKKANDNFWDPDEARNDMRNYLIERINEGLTAMPRERNTWESIIAALRTMPILQVLHEIYTHLKPEDQYAKGDTWDRSYYRMNVDLLFEQILAACNTDGLTVNSFAKSLNINVMSGLSVNSRIPQAEDASHIQCITVHKSKGLEYGHVIVPFAAFRIDELKRAKMNVSITDQADNLQIGYSLERDEHQGTYRNSFYNAQTEKAERSREESRILYVAMTRAIRSFSWIVQDDRKGLSWQSIILSEGD